MNEDIKRYMNLLESKANEKEAKKFSEEIQTEVEQTVEEETPLAEQLEAMMEMDYHEDLADVQNSLDTGISMVKDSLIRCMDYVEDFVNTVEQADGHLAHAYNDVEIPTSPNDIAMKLKIESARKAIAEAEVEMKKVFDHMMSIGQSMDMRIAGE